MPKPLLKTSSPNVKALLAFAFGTVFCGVLAYAGLRDKPIDDPGQFFFLRVLAAISASLEEGYRNNPDYWDGIFMATNADKHMTFEYPVSILKTLYIVIAAR